MKSRIVNRLHFPYAHNDKEECILIFFFIDSPGFTLYSMGNIGTYPPTFDIIIAKENLFDAVTPDWEVNPNFTIHNKV